MFWRQAFVVTCWMAVWGVSAAGARADDEQPSYWLGIVVHEPAESDVLKKLDVKNGLVVVQVVPKSPAAKAGIQAGDVLVKFGESKVKEVYQLLRLVNEHKDQPVEVQLFRDGKPLTVNVTVARRPKEFEPNLGEEKPERKKEASERDEANSKDEAKARVFLERAKALEQKARAEAEARDQDLLKLHRELGEAREAAAKARSAEAEARYTKTAGAKVISKNLQIAIGKVGNEPAKAHIQRDGQTWDVTEETLDTLPEELRDQVRKLFQQTAGEVRTIRSDAPKRDQLLIVPAAPGGKRIEIQLEEGSDKPRIHVERIERVERRAADAERDDHRDLEKRLDNVERKLDAILKALKASGKPGKESKRKKKDGDDD